jgi:hypothetical protein
MARLLASLTRIAEARLRDAGRRARLRAVLIAGCAAAGVAAARTRTAASGPSTRCRLMTRLLWCG